MVRITFGLNPYLSKKNWIESVWDAPKYKVFLIVFLKKKIGICKFHYCKQIKKIALFFFSIKSLD